jgi:Fe-Mn family superoxide dismutase
MNDNYPFKLQALPYAYDALMPYIDKETMMFHHDKHLQTYVDNLNNSLKDYPDYHNLTLEELLVSLDTLPTEIRTKVQNNAGGVFNHNLYFNLMTPNAKKEPTGKIKDAINSNFGSFENFKRLFKEVALGRFGSGWAWLVKNKENQLIIVSTPNQDVPSALKVKPVLLIDVWEHAYYLKYQNRRGEYIDNFFNVINWDLVEQKFIEGQSMNDFRYLCD